jgi:hypothetical protein
MQWYEGFKSARRNPNREGRKHNRDCQSIGNGHEKCTNCQMPDGFAFNDVGNLDSQTIAYRVHGNASASKLPFH